jgi:hypothetical protein
MTAQTTAAGSVAQNGPSTASDRCDCGWCEVDPHARAFFWRCYLGALVLLMAAIFLFT